MNLILLMVIFLVGGHVKVMALDVPADECPAVAQAYIDMNVTGNPDVAGAKFACIPEPTNEDTGRGS